MMILTGDRFYPNAENLLSILILQFVLFMHVYHLLYFVSNDNNKDVQSIIYQELVKRDRVLNVTIWPPYTVKPVYNDHLWNKIYYLWFIQ